MKRRKEEGNDGFEAWGGYMNAKITKLEEQFEDEAKTLGCHRKQSSIFEGVSIFVNGYSEPPAEVLRRLMLQHGGTFHDYQVSATTHVIASNLPNAKLQQQAFARVLRPEWVVDSVAAGKLLPIGPYLLCARSALQPALTFQPIAGDGGKKLAKTATDSSFINEFYNNSRLHHLSTMGALLKQYVGKLKDSHSGTFPGLDRLGVLVASEVDEGPPPAGERVIMHIDMDSFFVSVALRDRPQLAGRPVAVTHAKGNPSHTRPGADPAAERALYQARAGISDAKFNSKAGDANEQRESMSEIASCSYEARALGVRNGMYLGRALALCPGLLTVPYDFAAYTEVSYALYDAVAEYTLAVEAVSCDELFVDCTSALKAANSSASLFTKSLRSDVTARTRCPCSSGLGSNKLQARLASKKAKPNGQFHVRPGEVDAFMRDVLVKDLPGVGWSTTRKLQQIDAETCMDLQSISLATLKSELGGKTGETLYRFCRGIDDRPVVTEHQRKSVSAEVNYGIRFTTATEAEDFLRRLSGEVSDRLAGLSLRGRCVTLKLMSRSADAPVETAKFMGHGVCDSGSRSVMLPALTAEASVIADAVLKLYAQMGVAPEEMRGVGIQVSKLDGQAKAGTLQSFLAKQSQKSLKSEDEKLQKKTPEAGPSRKSSESPTKACLTTKSVKSGDEKPQKRKIPEAGPSRKNTGSPTKAPKATKAKLPGVFEKNMPTVQVTVGQPQLPPIAELDPEVISALPEEIRNELLAQYGARTLPGLEPVDTSEQNSCDAWTGRPVPPDLTDASSRDSTTSAPNTNLFAGLPPRELRAMISAWVEQEHTPEDCDVGMVARHAEALAANRRLEDLDVILRCFWRCVRSYRQGVAEWSAAYGAVVDQVQKVMVQVYKHPLRVMLL